MWLGRAGRREVTKRVPAGKGKINMFHRETDCHGHCLSCQVTIETNSSYGIDTMM